MPPMRHNLISKADRLLIEVSPLGFVGGFGVFEDPPGPIAVGLSGPPVEEIELGGLEGFSANAFIECVSDDAHVILKRATA